MSNEILEKLNALLAAEQELNRLIKAENEAIARQRDELLAVCQRLLVAYDAKAPSCGCDETSPCAWHGAKQAVDGVCGDKYGDWYANRTGQGEAQ